MFFGLTTNEWAWVGFYAFLALAIFATVFCVIELFFNTHYCLMNPSLGEKEVLREEAICKERVEKINFSYLGGVLSIIAIDISFGVYYLKTNGRI